MPVSISDTRMHGLPLINQSLMNSAFVPDAFIDFDEIGQPRVLLKLRNRPIAAINHTFYHFHYLHSSYRDVSVEYRLLSEFNACGRCDLGCCLLTSSLFVLEIFSSQLLSTIIRLSAFLADLND